MKFPRTSLLALRRGVAPDLPFLILGKFGEKKLKSILMVFERFRQFIAFSVRSVTSG